VSTEIVKALRFDVAHVLPTAPPGHAYRRMHGHSFEVELAASPIPRPAGSSISP
jgi:6-pyruvoyltetrahydropterin/6-carboxytetrahydropterin synthase